MTIASSRVGLTLNANLLPGKVVIPEGRCGRSGNKRDSAATLCVSSAPDWRRPERESGAANEQFPAIRERQLFRHLPRGLGGDVGGQSRPCAGLWRGCVDREGG